MKTYRYGKWRSPDGIASEGTTFYSVDKKTFFGRKEVEWWHYNAEGKKKMLDMVEQLKKLGNLVIEN